MLWVLLWVYVPDQSPEQFSFSDVLRTSFLLFSFVAFGFALLMMIIRYKGIDLISRLTPHAGLALWLGKHAYEYSQPKSILFCSPSHGLNHKQLFIQTSRRKHEICLDPAQMQVVDLGFLMEEPTLQWLNNDGQIVEEQLHIKERLKRFGRNIHIDVTIDSDQMTFRFR